VGDPQRFLLSFLLSFTCSVGHHGKFGHEFLEFEFQPNGRLRYANNSNYKKDSMIRKEGSAPEKKKGLGIGNPMMGGPGFNWELEKD